MKNYCRSIVALASAGALFLTGARTASAAPVATWTFENNSVGINNNPAPSVGSGSASSIGMDLYPTPNLGVTTDDVVLSKSTDTGANAVANTSNVWRIRAQAGANGVANGWSSLAPIGTQGAVFAASTMGYNSINVSFDWYTTTQGEANLQLQYTTDGTRYHNVPITLSGSDAGLQVLNNSASANTVQGSYISDNLVTNGAPAGQNWFTGLTAAITDPAAAGNPNFAFELVNASTGADDVSTQGTALNNSSGNWRFNNIAISGTATPEPTTFSVIGLGGIALLARRKRA